MRSAPAAFLDRAARTPDAPALRVLAAGGAPRDVTLTWAGWRDGARRLAAALVSAGLRPGERVAIAAGNGLVWPVTEVGALLAGGVTVGTYPTAAPAQVAQLVADCEAAVLVADTAEQLARWTAVRAETPSVRLAVCAEPADGATAWDAFLARGGAALADPAVCAELDRRLVALGPEDVAGLVYTSGSTGAPKGARLPHRYLLASAASIRDTLGLVEGDSSLSFLPFCHAAERVFGLWTRVVVGMEAGLVADPGRVWEAAAAFHPTLFGGLPRFYEKAADALQAERLAASGAARDAWERAVEAGTERARLRRAGLPVPGALEAAWTAAMETVRPALAARFGGRLRLATSGGATLPAAAAGLLEALGVTVLGGYGMTEHLCVAFHRPGAPSAPDDVGPPMEGTDLRIAPDGEILVRRGPLTFAGYHGREDETAAAFTADGAWLLTGDTGETTPGGALRVTGRKKELIALSTGKKVAPLPIEERLAREPWIGQAMLYGEGERFVSALLAVRRATLERWAAERRRPADDPSLAADPELRAHLQAAVDRVNAGLSRTERIRAFVVLPRELTVEDGELTPTLKLRRADLAAKFGAPLRDLYRAPR